MKGLIIIPAYNEEKSIVNAVERIKEYPAGFDYIVVNDCSEDSTLEICREKDIPVLDLPVNLGIGGAVQTGYRYALKQGYDYAVQMDGDAQHNPEYLRDMLFQLEKNGADMVIGSRFINNEGFLSSPLRRFGIRFFSGLIKLLTNHQITDPTSGYRMVNRKLIKSFADDYPRDYPEPESLVTVLKRGYKVREIPVKMNVRKEGVSSIGMLGSAYYMIKVTIAVIMEDICFK